MAGIKSSSASPVRRKQLMLLAGLGIVVVLVAGLAALIGSPPKRVEREKPEVPIRKQIGATETGVSEKEIWRTQEGARVTQLQDELKDLRDKLKSGDDQRKTEDTKRVEEDRQKSEAEARRLALAQNPPPPQPLGIPGGPMKVIAPQGGPDQRLPGQLGAPKMLNQSGPVVVGQDGQPVEQARGIVKINITSDTSGNSSTSGGLRSGTASNVVPGVVPAASTGGMGTGSLSVDSPRPVRKTTENFLPSGTFLRATNLGGLDAPTGGQVQQNPHPIVFRIVDFASLPNKFRADYKECFVTGNGYGDLSSERAYIRLDRLSCISEDGAAIDVSIKGYVAGEDGKAGMRGKLISKQGSVLANALIAGIASGIGTAFVQSNTQVSTSALGTTSTVDPAKSLQAGVGTGAGKAMDKLSSYYIALAEKMFPIVEIDSGREVDIVITRGISLER